MKPWQAGALDPAVIALRRDFRFGLPVSDEYKSRNRARATARHASTLLNIGCRNDNRAGSCIACAVPPTMRTNHVGDYRRIVTCVNRVAPAPQMIIPGVSGRDPSMPKRELDGGQVSSLGARFDPVTSRPDLIDKMRS
jgi:hypothetical protein